MARLPSTVRDFAAYAEEVGYAGRCDELKLPEVALATEEYRAGGLGGTVDLPMGHLEKMEAEMMLSGLDPEYTRVLGQEDGALTFRGSIGDGFTEGEAIFEMRGFFKKAAFGDLKTGDKGSTRLTCNVRYFKATIADVVVLEVDIINKRWVVDGVDRFAAQRAALGE